MPKANTISTSAAAPSDSFHVQEHAGSFLSVTARPLSRGATDPQIQADHAYWADVEAQAGMLGWGHLQPVSMTVSHGGRLDWVNRRFRGTVSPGTA
jgi:hypothetical protein